MQLKDALKGVRSFLQGLGSTEETGDIFAGVITFGEEDFGWITLSGTERTGYINCLDVLAGSVLKEDWFGKRGVEKLLQQAILKVWDKRKGFKQLSERRITQAVDWLRDALKAEPKSYLVLLPVLGIDRSTLPHRIGKVTFLPGDGRTVASVKRTVSAIVASLKNEQSQKTALERYTAEDIDDSFRNNIIAEVEVRAGDIQTAEEKATRECRNTIDTLNFYSDVFANSNGNACVRLLGEGNQVIRPIKKRKGQRLILVMRERCDADEGATGYKDRQIAEYSARRSSRGTLSELNLPRQDSPLANTSGLARLCELLSKDDRTSLDNRILAAFQWAGRATVDTRREEAFLLYMIALESLVLMKSDKTETTFQLKIKTAHLLKGTATERKELASRLGKLYAIRSKIVHSGSFRVTDSDVSEIRQFSKAALVTVLNSKDFKEMKTEEQFDDWLEERILS